MKERIVFFRRTALALVMLGGTAGCDVNLSVDQKTCPQTPAEVAHQTGGDPKGWKPMEGLPGAWGYKGRESGQEDSIFTAPKVGRLDIAGTGNVSSRTTVRTRNEAWYTCFDPRPDPTPPAQ